MKKNKKKILPEFKKELEDFFFSEEGKIDKKTVAQIGLTLGLLAAVFTPAQACHGSHSNATPSNDFYGTAQGGHMSGNTAMHSSHPSHTSHGSHGQW